MASHNQDARPSTPFGDAIVDIGRDCMEISPGIANVAIESTSVPEVAQPHGRLGRGLQDGIRGSVPIPDMNAVADALLSELPTGYVLVIFKLLWLMKLFLTQT